MCLLKNTISYWLYLNRDVYEIKKYIIQFNVNSRFAVNYFNAIGGALV